MYNIWLPYSEYKRETNQNTNFLSVGLFQYKSPVFHGNQWKMWLVG